MPPRKRKAPTKAPIPANKKARVEENPAPEGPEEQIPRRPKRKSVGTPQYNFTRTRKQTKKQADDGVKAEDIVAPVEPPKRRGRPPKVAPSNSIEPSPATARQVSSKNADKTAPSGKRRGRPRLTANLSKKKASVPKSAATKGTNPSTSTARPRGRPPKKSKDRPLTATARSQQTVVSLLATLSEATAFADAGTDDYLSTDEDSSPPIDDDDDDDCQYWLMKAEPNSRFENGVDVKFSIDDLAAASEPEPWDGVRNFGARNNMRAMRRGDLCFFYHSNCPVPGVVGVMRVVQEHSPDESAFDPSHPYYDPKSTDRTNPRWDVVHVEFVKKFESMVSLKAMQENKKGSGPLQNMQLLKMGRLSVSAVTAQEWKCVLDMANEDPDVGVVNEGSDNNTVDDGEDKGEEVVNGIGGDGGQGGYESDTDGEVNDTGPPEELNGVTSADQHTDA